MSGSFHDRLIAVRDKNHSKDHPFFDLWRAGKLTKEQTAFYCTQHFHYVGEYLNWLAYEASQIPKRDVKHWKAKQLDLITGKGPSKKQAEEAAAREALLTLQAEQ